MSANGTFLALLTYLFGICANIRNLFATENRKNGKKKMSYTSLFSRELHYSSGFFHKITKKLFIFKTNNAFHVSQINRNANESEFECQLVYPKSYQTFLSESFEVQSMLLHLLLKISRKRNIKVVLKTFRWLKTLTLRLVEKKTFYEIVLFFASKICRQKKLNFFKDLIRIG